jgi:hypothetical protein
MANAKKKYSLLKLLGQMEPNLAGKKGNNSKIGNRIFFTISG